jgi:prevent-host-death family protein
LSGKSHWHVTLPAEARLATFAGVPRILGRSKEAIPAATGRSNARGFAVTGATLLEPETRPGSGRTRPNVGTRLVALAQVSASDAKNNFGGLLEDVAALGRVDIIKHGRLVAVVVSPRAANAYLPMGEIAVQDNEWGKKHMIPPESARAARMVGVASSFDEE